MPSSVIHIPFEGGAFDGFFCSYLIEGEVTYLVDVGPYNSVHGLLRSLAERGVRRLDYVLLTHLHIDHAGGLGPILEAFEDAKVICHRLGLKILTEPERIWGPSLQVLKHRAIEYGKPDPVPVERLIPHEQAQIPGVAILDTPGHASHHISFVSHDEVFSGEAGGNHFMIGGTSYLRPATPPRFFLEEALRSVDLLIETGRKVVCYAHCGKGKDGEDLLRMFKEQLIYWFNLISKLIDTYNDIKPQDIVEELLRQDSRLKGFENFDEVKKEREREFLQNSVNGFLGYIKEKRSYASPQV